MRNSPTEPLQIIAKAYADEAMVYAYNLQGRSRLPVFSHPRQAAMAAMKDAGHTYVAIGAYLGNRHPDTIKKGIRAHNRRNAK